MGHAEQIEALKGLLERVRRATGPDRAIDVRILALLQQPGEWSGSDIEYACADPERTCAPPRYTGSVDAALTLMERVLPGWDAHIYRDDDDGGRFAAEMVWPPDTDIGEAGHYDMDGRHAPTRALAIVQGIIGSAEVLLSAKLALLTQEEGR